MTNEMTYGRRMLVLAICCLSLFLVGMDSTIVNVALPAIEKGLHASVTGLQWTIDAYTLVLASLLVLAGSTGDRLGRRRVFQIGLFVFTLGSGLCSVAPNLTLLVVFRMVQAVGGSMLNPVAMSIITNTFTDAKERARAIGMWGGVVGLSMALGPVLGGFLVDGIGWRSVFWINIPIGLAAIGLTQRFLPESRAARARRLDPVGQVLVVLGLASLVYAIIEGPHHGWGSTFIVGLFVLCAASFVALVAIERRTAEPLIDVRFFRSAPFSGATVIAVAALAALSGFLFLNTLYLQDVRGYSPLHAGLLTLPAALMTAICAPLAGRIVAHRGPRAPLVIAGVFVAAGAALLTGLTPTTSLAHLLIAYTLFGTGFGFVNAPVTNTAVSGMPREQAGVAAAVTSTSRQVGQSLGVAVLGSLIASSAGDIVAASHTGFAVLVGCGVVVLGVGWASTGGWARGTSDRTRELMRTASPVPDRTAAAVG